MKEFCNLIRLYLISDVKSVQEECVVLKPESVYYDFYTDDYSLSMQAENALPGTIVEVDEHITVDKVDRPVAAVFAYRRSVLIEVFRLPGKERVLLGSIAWPANVYITSGLNKDTMHLSVKMRQSPLL